MRCRRLWKSWPIFSSRMGREPKRTVVLMAERACRRLIVVYALLMGTACMTGAQTTTLPTAERMEGDVAEYSFGGVDGQLIGSRAMRDRVTVLLFVTTFDLGSQVQAKRLEGLYRGHAPRLNALAVALEPPRNVDLARSYREVLELSYPIAMADPATLSGEGPFGDVRTVPTWVILDRRGVVREVVQGPLSPQELEALVEKAER